MKETPTGFVYNRANTPMGGGVINGPQWQTVRPVPMQQPVKQNAFPWRWLIFVGGLVWISSLVWNHSKTPQERSQPPRVQSTTTVPESPPQVRVARALPIRVERALPVKGAPRAEAVSTGEKIDQSWLAEQSNIGKWIAIKIPGEGSIWAHYQGQLPDVTGLPANPQAWDWYYTADGNSWVWMRSAATGQMAWLDP